MIYCPNCKEEIENDSHFCDQCGQALMFCERCGRVGIGRRCTACGGMMITPEDHQRNQSSSNVFAATVTKSHLIPTLLLYSDTLGIRLIGESGAIVGRRNGPYQEQLGPFLYISGSHAQLKYNPNRGWHIIDMHSSNGTKLNDHKLQPEVEMSLQDGDIVAIANVVLKVSIK